MKFNVPVLILALSFPLLTAAECAGCDAKSLDAIGQCQPPWVDKVIACQNSPCNVKFPDDPILQCQGNLGDGSLNVTSTIATRTQHMTTTGTPTGTSTPSSTSTSTTTSTSTGNGTERGNSTNTSTTSSPNPTGNSAAALAFRGIGFGGGAAAMVGLAGLVGLVL
ncbi:hypothetical protein BGX38DRAFT_1193284 [Terfezia claveryi]|nr:hypothetical protein BGX38DRAFT_1193284 [Terfezia claveryi]